MKSSLLLSVLSLLFCSNSVIAQQDRKYSFFSEAYVLKYSFKLSDREDYFSGTKQSMPAYGHTFDPNDPYRNYELRNDSVFQRASSSRNNQIYKDYRNITIGLSRPVFTNKLFHLTYGMGLNYAVSNTDIGLFADDHYYSYSYDSIYKYNYGLTDSSFNIHLHEQTKRLGLVCDFSAALKASKAFRFSFGVRNTFGFTYDDKIYVQYNQNLDKVGRLEKVMNCFGPLIDFSGANLYRNERPANDNYQVIERKMKPQLDMSVYTKSELLLGKKRQTSVYLFVGFTLMTQYGKQYKNSGASPSYGIGISRTL